MSLVSLGPLSGDSVPSYRNIEIEWDEEVRGRGHVDVRISTGHKGPPMVPGAPRVTWNKGSLIQIELD